jgi:uncharacterized protein (DUF433 family)
MTSRPVSLRIPEDVRTVIDDVARRSRRPFSSVANEMLEEAVKMRRIPGIYFVDRASGRTACIQGTGLGVWEIIRDFRDMGESWDAIREGYHWLSENQLRSALAYAQAYPKEIDTQVREANEWTTEQVYATYPFMRPPGR